MAMLVAAIIIGSLVWPVSSDAFNITLVDDTRNRNVTAIICSTQPRPLDLYVFAHGGGLYAGDYDYLCEGTSEYLGVFALLVSPASDDPMDLTIMANDVQFLAAHLPLESHASTSPLYGRLTSSVVLTGHSMGAAAVLLAATVPSNNVKAVMAIAPGFWGPQQSELLQGIHAMGISNLCMLPYLQLAGDQDCANSLSAQALSIWGNVTDACGNQQPRALAVLKGATHCQWTTPVVGSCPFDKPCPVPHLERGRQQQLGLSLLYSLAQGHMEEDLRAMSPDQLSFVDQASKKDDISKLHSYCPCGSTFDV